jgi:ribosome-binding factor A
LRIHSAPELDFRLDASVAHAARIETLLAQIKDGTVDPNAASDLD